MRTNMQWMIQLIKVREAFTSRCSHACIHPSNLAPHPLSFSFLGSIRNPSTNFLTNVPGLLCTCMYMLQWHVHVHVCVRVHVGTLIILVGGSTLICRPIRDCRWLSRKWSPYLYIAAVCMYMCMLIALCPLVLLGISRSRQIADHFCERSLFERETTERRGNSTTYSVTSRTIWSHKTLTFMQPLKPGLM